MFLLCKKKTAFKTLGLALGLALTLACLAAPPIASPLDPNSRKTLVDTIAAQIEQRYVDPKLGTEAANFIKMQLTAGKYRSITDNQRFAKRLTQDLQTVNRDKHMRVFANRPPRQESGENNPIFPILDRLRSWLDEDHGFKAVTVLPGNIGYIDFRYFSGNPAARSAAASALKLIENTDAVIFDLRHNRGGDPGMVLFICSYFFDKRTHLNSLYWRQGDWTEEFWTLDNVPGNKRPEVPVFILTSGRTFSGAEEFAYNFQTQNRGIIIGEVTGGGANPGSRFQINDTFSVFIPTGKAINPVTGTNWEGIGVIPHVQTTSGAALDKALELALSAAKKFKENVIRGQPKNQ